MQPVPPYSALTCCCTTSMLVVAVWHAFCGIFFSSNLFCPLRFQSFPQTCLWEGFLWCGNFSSFTTPSPGRVSISKCFVSVFVFYILSYLIWREWTAFWVPGVLRQCSKVVLWKLLSIQMIFWWICGGGSGLPVLFLCHLKTAYSPNSSVFASLIACLFFSSLLKDKFTGFRILHW